MKSIKNSIKRHALLTYYILTFAISWVALLLVMGPEGFLGVKEVPESQMPLLFLAVLAGPTIAGLLMIAFLYGRAGLRGLLKRMLKFRAGGRWYAVALLTAPLVMIMTLAVLAQFSPAFLPSIVTTDDRVSFLLAGIMGGLSAGIFEELGWTGFAVPEHRRRHGVLVTGVIVGILWGAWHFPLFAGSGRYSEAIPPALYVFVLLFSILPPFRVLMVWVYGRTGSLAIAMLMHGSLTASTMILQPSVTGVQALTFNLAVTAALWLIVIAVARSKKRQRLQPRQTFLAEQTEG